MTAPERVRALGLLCPAVAWVKRGFHPLARLLRPEFGLLPHLEAPYGRHGLYPRLAELRNPALFGWGSNDRLIPDAFGRHVRRWLPSAEQVTREHCGHIPQVEHPEECNELLISFFGRADANAVRVGPPGGSATDVGTVAA